MDDKRRSVAIEEVLTQFERVKDDYATDFSVDDTQKAFTSPEFFAYYLNAQNKKPTPETQRSLGLTEAMIEKYKVSNAVRVFGTYGTRKALSETVKLLGDLSYDESVRLARRIFHPGPATDLLAKMDGGTGTMIKRMIALGYHE